MVTKGVIAKYAPSLTRKRIQSAIEKRDNINYYLFCINLKQKDYECLRYLKTLISTCTNAQSTSYLQSKIEPSLAFSEVPNFLSLGPPFLTVK